MVPAKIVYVRMYSETPSIITSLCSFLCTRYYVYMNTRALPQLYLVLYSTTTLLVVVVELLY
jgi:hypothetical protein